MLADIQLQDAVIAGNMAVDFNGYTVSGTLLGTMRLNGGTLVTAQGYPMIGAADTCYYQSSDAVLEMISLEKLTIVSGNITLDKLWWTMPNQMLTIGENVNFTITENGVLNVQNTVVVHGNVTVYGQVDLYNMDASVTITEGKVNEKNIVTSAGETVLYTDGKYVAHNHSFGEVTYTHTDDHMKWTATRSCDCGELQTATTEASVYTEAAKCEVAGYTEYTANFTETWAEMQQETVVIPALGHDIVVDKAVDATCTSTGLTAGQHCSRCDAETVAQEEIPALGHNEVTDEAKAPTCTETGLTEGKHCSVCGVTLVAQDVVPAKGHTEEAIAGKDATCTETGLTAGKKCSVCGEVLVAQQTVNALGHTEVEIPAEKATCVDPGATAGVKCSVCDEILTAPVEVPATGEHSYVNGTCEVCGDVSAPEYHVVLSGRALNYQSEILAQIFVVLPDELLAEENAKVVLTKDGTWGSVERVYTAAELRGMTRDSSGRHTVEIGLASPEYGRKIKIEVFDGQGNAVMLYSNKGTALGTAREVSAIDYAKSILTGAKYSQEEKDLVAALLTYGGYAQKFFKVDVDAPVYNSLTDLGIAIPDISSVTADLVGHKATQNTVKNGISTTGFEAVLDSSTSFRIFLSLAQGEDPGDYDFELTYIYAGQEKTKPITATFNEKDRRFCVVIEDIPSAYWDYMYKVSVTKKSTGETYEVSASILAWVRQIIKSSESSEQLDLAKAMYLYNQAANAFFKK